jgi:ribosomal protein S18 acetylase RimI-like enzyme
MSVPSVLNTTKDDLPEIFSFFESSIQYQEQKGYPIWKNYDRNAITTDIDNGNQYKVIVEQQTAIVFSVCYRDKIIWRQMDDGNSLYLHRIVVNPKFKGQKLFGRILDWCVQHSVQKKLANIRMDTWAANPNIIDYYNGFGFRVIENYTTPDTADLPVHNRKLELTLLEYDLHSSSAHK